MRNRPSYLASLVAVLLVTAACSGGPLLPSSDETGGASVSASVSQSQVGMRLVYCKPFDEASKTATIGLLGGTIKVGPHTLLVPPGALWSPTRITAQIAKNDYSHSVIFSPSGLRFSVPAVVTLSYAGCDRPTLLKPLQVVYTSDNLGRILSLLPSINNPLNKTTTGTIDHFSRYAIAY